MSSAKSATVAFETARQHRSVHRKNSLLRMNFRRLMKNKLAVTGLVVVIAMIVIAVFAPILAPQGYEVQDLTAALKGPCKEYWLGTDNLGRDMLSRLIYGARNSLLIAFSAPLLAMIIGTLLGLTAGYFGGTVDTILMRFLDIFATIPNILLAISISAALGMGLKNCIIALCISEIPGFARMSRAASLSIAGLDYIEAARAMDLSSFSIIVRHLFPNCLSPLIVQLTSFFSNAVITSAGLSFIGLGVQPPEAEWGAMLSLGRNYIRNAPHMLIVPLVVILIFVLSLNLLGDGLRDALDPKLKK